MQVTRRKAVDLLLIPPLVSDNLWTNNEFIPVGLLCIYASLKKYNFTSRIFSFPKDSLDYLDIDEVSNQIIVNNPQIVGFSTWCNNYPFVLLLSRKIKSKKDIPILLGGPQASIVASETLKHFHSIDYIIRGEAETSVIQLLNVLIKDKTVSLSKVSGLTYRNRKGKVLSNPVTAIENDLDRLPIPAYELLDHKSRYRIDAGRGCPYRCTYCTTNVFFSRKPRTKSPSRIIKEMDYCNARTGAHSFGLIHDMLTTNKKFVDSLCNSFIEHDSSTGNKYKWTCSARTDSLPKESIQKLAKSGCQDIFFGIETGSQRIQKEINKNLDLEYATDVIKYSSSYGIRPTVSFMAGFPGETESELEKSLKLILRMVLLGAKPQMTMLSILPGTSMHKENAGDLKFDAHFSGFTNALLTDTEISLIKNYPEIFSSFYYLPNKTLSRDLLTFVVSLVNLIPDFLVTLRLLQKYIDKDTPKICLLDYVKNGLKSYKDEKDLPEPEYFFLTNSLKDYLIYCSYLKNGPPDFIWDVFNGDCIKAYLKIKYYKQVQKNVEGLSEEPKLVFQYEGTNYQVNPISKFIKLTYDVSIIYNCNAFKKQGSFGNLEKGEHDFLFVNESGRESILYKLTKNQADLLKSVTNSKNKTDSLNELMPKNKIRDTINELINYKALFIIK